VHLLETGHDVILRESDYTTGLATFRSVHLLQPAPRIVQVPLFFMWRVLFAGVTEKLGRDAHGRAATAGWGS